MAVPVSLVKVGNSNAFIIPSRILKQMNLKENTKFELSLEVDSAIRIRKVSSKESPVFPKIRIPSVSDTEMQSFIEGLTQPSALELENDERMSYILGK